MCSILAYRALRSGLAILLAGATFSSHAQGAPSVAVALDAEEVYVGEVFHLHVRISNASTWPPMNLTVPTDDFSVEFVGKSDSTTIINGRRRDEQMRKYRVVALKSGTLQFPSFNVTVDGKNFATEPKTIVVREPEPVDEFKLVCTFSKDECYVGEPVTLTSTIYIGDRVSGAKVSLPILTSSQFHVEPLELVRQSNRDYYEIPVNDRGVEAEKGEGRLDGKPYLTLTFKHIVVPLEAGQLTAPNGTVSLEVPTGTRRRRSPFDGISIFGSSEPPKLVIVPSNPIALSVRPVPEEGKPANFSGLVGTYAVAATASPTSVNVGDPITLNVMVQGSRYLRHFELPSLQQQEALAAQFRIPEDMAPGRAENDQKIFTQTIRALSDDVTEIPPITLSYFDTRSGAYATAASDPIPLAVRQTEVVTAADAEGYQPTIETVEHIAVDAGIAHNFTGAATLRNQRFGPDVWLRTPGSWLLLLLPPILYGGLASFVYLQRTGGLRAEGRNRKLALAHLEAALNESTDTGDVFGTALDALRSYLGTKLGLNPSALTYADARGPLTDRGVGEASLAALKSVFDACEAHRYAGGSASGAAGAEFLESVKDCARTLDREIGPC